MSIKKFVALSLTLVLFHNFVIPFAYANGLYLAPPAAFFYFLILITYGIFSPAVLIYLLPITLGILFERTYILTRSFAVTVCLIVFIGPLFSWFSIGSGSSIFASYYLFFVTIFLLFTFLITIMSFLFSSLGNKIAIVRNLQFRINGLSSRFKIGLILLSYLLTILLIFISNEIPLLLSKSSMFVYPFITYLIFFLFIFDRVFFCIL
ncbi:hypothetical protein HY612_04170, partial [Candidatus Roizmanbacteria bacterium]|nr:hypothetical protein [Candidatus Roizmanbacteria bacterium]